MTIAGLCLAFGVIGLIVSTTVIWGFAAAYFALSVMLIAGVLWDGLLKRL